MLFCKLRGELSNKLSNTGEDIYEYSEKIFLVIGLIAIAFGVCVPSQDPFIVPNTTEDKVAAENIIQDAQKLKGSSQSHTHLNNWYIQKN